MDWRCGASREEKRSQNMVVVYAYVDVDGGDELCGREVISTRGGVWERKIFGSVARNLCAAIFRRLKKVVPRNPAVSQRASRRHQGARPETVVMVHQAPSEVRLCAQEPTEIEPTARS